MLDAKTIRGHDMAKVKLSDRVQSLIDRKQYNDAIKLLSGVDSPRATDWIRRIEALQAAEKRQGTRNATIGLLVFLFACIASCSLYFWFA